MKHQPIVDKCEYCSKITFNAENEKVCDLYPNPSFIWQRGYCPVKTRQEEPPEDYWTNFGNEN